MENAMTNEEIQCVILKVGYNDPRGVVYLPRINTDYGIDMKRVRSNTKYLESQGLVKTWKVKVGGRPRMPDAHRVEITEQGIREYKSRCE